MLLCLALDVNLMRQAIRERVLVGQDRGGTPRLPAQWADSRIAWREGSWEGIREAVIIPLMECIFKVDFRDRLGSTNKKAARKRKVPKRLAFTTRIL